MTVRVPADGFETANAVKAAMEIDGPVYIRIGRGFEPPFYESENYGFKVGKGVEINPGSDITIITCGIGVLQSVMAAKDLAKEGISVRVINMHTIKPIDKDIILKAVLDTRRILTVEEHNIIGGLGDAVDSVIAESGKGCAFKKAGIPDEFSVIGYPEDLYAHYGLDADGIAMSVREIMKREFEEDENWDDEV
jgi:transketolase